MSLSVVYVADTGHVVGALALTGAAELAGDVGALVGTALPLRVSLGAGEIATLPLQDRRLAVAAADDEPAVLGEPLAFGVELASENKPKPTLQRLAPWFTQFALTASTLTVSLPEGVNATRDTPVLVLISDGPDAHLLTGEIPAGQGQAIFQVALTEGDTHGLLVLVAGQVGRLEAVAVR